MVGDRQEPSVSVLAVGWASVTTEAPAAPDAYRWTPPETPPDDWQP
jgi:hypothetical protein